MHFNEFKQCHQCPLRIWHILWQLCLQDRTSKSLLCYIHTYSARKHIKIFKIYSRQDFDWPLSQVADKVEVHYWGLTQGGKNFNNVPIAPRHILRRWKLLQLVGHWTTHVICMPIYVHTHCDMVNSCMLCNPTYKCVSFLVHHCSYFVVHATCNIGYLKTSGIPCCAIFSCLYITKVSP